MKMKKRLLSILLSLVMVLGLMPGMSLTALAVAEQSESLTATSNTTTGNHFKIIADASDSDGAAVGKYVNTWSTTTVSSLNGENIKRIEATAGLWFSNASLAVDSGTINRNGNSIIVNDINATSVTFTQPVSGELVQLKTFTIYYDYPVTYKVVNGTWSDGSTTDKKETVQSGAKPASVPTGMKASEGYTGGAWDTNPADATITGATTFTYTFTAKQAATVTKAPTAKTLTYTGQAQELITAGEAEGGTMPGQSLTNLAPNV